jgi:hypothetical protein
MNDLYNAKAVSIDYLSGETIVYLCKGISKEYYIARIELEKNKEIHILVVDFFDINIYIICEYHNYVLISADIMADTHPNLHNIPIDWNYTLPYGVIYARQSKECMEQFLEILKEAAKQYSK